MTNTTGYHPRPEMLSTAARAQSIWNWTLMSNVETPQENNALAGITSCGQMACTVKNSQFIFEKYKDIENLFHRKPPHPTFCRFIKAFLPVFDAVCQKGISSFLTPRVFWLYLWPAERNSPTSRLFTTGFVDTGQYTQTLAWQMTSDTNRQTHQVTVERNFSVTRSPTFRTPELIGSYCPLWWQFQLTLHPQSHS